MAEILVTNGNDTGTGSLRWAIDQTNMRKASVIVISKDVHVIVLKRGELIVRSTVHIKVEKRKEEAASACGGNNNTQPSLTQCVEIVAAVGARIFRIPPEAATRPCVRFTLTGPFLLSPAPADETEKKGEEAKRLIKFGGAIASTGRKAVVVLDNVRIIGHQAINGGGILSLSQLILKNSQVSANTAFNLGGGIYSANNITSQSSSIIGNRVKPLSLDLAQSHSSPNQPEAVYSGGGLFVDSGTVVFNDSVIMKNTISVKQGIGSGGGIAMMEGNLHILNGSSVSDNASFDSAGIVMGIGNIYISKKSHVDNNVSVNDNTGAAGGGGVTITSGLVSLDNESSISGNKTRGMYSGGVVSFLGSIVVGGKSAVQRNVNRGPGGGLALNFNGSVIVSGGSKISHNRGSSLGGGIVNFSLGSGLIYVSGNSKVTSNKLSNAQTIGETIKAFLSVAMKHMGSMESISASSSNAISQNEDEKKDDSSSSSLDAIRALIPEFKARASEVATSLENAIALKKHLSAIAGGGIASVLGSPVVIESACHVSRNDATLNVRHEASVLLLESIGGGIFAGNAPVSLNPGSIVNENKATRAGGGVFTGNRSVVGLETTVAHNHVGHHETDEKKKNSHKKKRTAAGSAFALGSQNAHLTLIQSNVEDNQGSRTAIACKASDDNHHCNCESSSRVTLIDTCPVSTSHACEVVRV